MIPSTYTNSSSNGSSTRGRTPAPPSTRQRLGSATSSISSSTASSGINYGSTYTPSSSSSYYDSSSYRPASRPASRQSSVERSTGSANLDNYNSLINSSFFGSSHRLSDIANSSTVRSRNSSPSRFDSDSKYSSYSSNRNLTSLPPHPTYDSYRSKRETSTERSLLRNRREASQERSTPRPSASSVLLKLRRSSYVDNGPSKY